MCAKIVCVIVMALAIETCSWAQWVPNDRAKNWVRSHPFTIYGAVYETTSPVDMVEYKASEMNGLWSGVQIELAQRAIDAGLILHYVPAPPDHVPSGMDEVNQLTTATSDNPWYCYDEPTPDMLNNWSAPMISWLKVNRPNCLTYINLNDPSDSNVNNVMNVAKPDMLMYDNYIFALGAESNMNLHFSWMSLMRTQSVAYGMPFFVWLQSFTGSNYYRFASESEIRMQAYSYLAGGCKGFGYFRYWYPQGDYNADWSLLRKYGDPTPLYYSVATLNTEISNLGRVLRYIQSSDLRFIRGGSNPTPQGLSNWTYGAGGNSHVVGTSVGSVGAGKNGLIGFFTDDSGVQYVMVTNLYCGSSMSAADATLTVSVTFDTGTNGVWRLNRQTGAQEWIFLVSNHQLSLQLTGGTGELLCLSPSGFDLAPPTGSISIASVNQTTWVARLNISATDDKGVAKMRFSNDNLTWSDWEPYATIKDWPAAQGQSSTKTVYVRFQDTAGSISTVYSDTITLDIVPPSAPGTPTDIGIYTSNPSITFNWTAATDAESGIASYTCAIGTTPSGSEFLTANVGNALQKTIGGVDGDTYYCRTRAKDKAGNYGPWSGNSDGIMLDMSDPLSGAASSPATATGSPIQVSYAGASDNVSGVKNVELWFKKESWGTWTYSGMSTPATSGSFSFVPAVGSGTYYFGIVAEDNAGNRSAIPTGDGNSSTVFGTVYSISGHVTLEDYSGGLELIPIKIEIMQGGSVLATKIVSLSADYTYTLSDLPAGAYDLALTACKWLCTVVHDVVVPDGIAGGINVHLKNGDLDGDNAVTSADVSILLKNTDMAGK